MSKDVESMVKAAAAAAKHVPENLQEAAFNRAFDALLAAQRGDAQVAAGDGRRLHPHTSDAKQTAAPDPDLLKHIDRTAHPEIRHDATALDNSLRILLAARQDLGIDGLTASTICRVLTDNFRCNISRQAVSKALNDAGRHVSRRKEGNEVIFRIMQPGERYLEEAATKGDSGARRTAVAPRRTNQKKRRGQAEKSNSKGTKTSSRTSMGPGAALKAIYEADFFSSPRTIADMLEHIRHLLGRTFKQNEMSPGLLRYLRAGKLSRSKNADNQYEYENA